MSDETRLGPAHTNLESVLIHTDDAFIVRLADEEIERIADRVVERIREKAIENRVMFR